ncbi:hypothetical protein ABID08_002069 [Rhizobium binae]|uniref:DUF3168 domain-containing protein n=1 Tax=Rhizobium binae TaxID=1138190 RepID=A0ABV2MGQ1_9HYPH|nr:DUF3168 domain-containing protein [Rhizobium binae]MBX4992896.1 DUF3168 domain-containing protein [Rhizobium binae]NKL47200.1 DUF3168 domain-containing protein [Rhizobium leguminosarum bv. viciae]QSY84163.1 DUF3168 domain-containing protein [Rhizobium binae]
MDPVFELKAAVIGRLKADAALAAFVAGNVFDRPPDGAKPSPYISMGPWDATTDEADCIDGMEINMQIDCWSWGGGEAFSSAEVSKIAGAVRSALHEAEFELSTNALATISHRITRYQRESDGATNRAIITVTAFVELP